MKGLKSFLKMIAREKAILFCRLEEEIQSDFSSTKFAYLDVDVEIWRYQCLNRPLKLLILGQALASVLSTVGYRHEYFIGHWSSFSYKDGAVEFQLNVGLNYRGIFPEICNGDCSEQNASKYVKIFSSFLLLVNI